MGLRVRAFAWTCLAPGWGFGIADLPENSCLFLADLCLETKPGLGFAS